MKASVDQEGCIECGLCTNLCPEVFSFADDGKAQAIEGDIENSNIEAAEEARDSCPVSVIDLC